MLFRSALRGQASSVAGRVAGYRQALHHAGEVLYATAGATRFEALVCSNDHIAGHAMLALLAKGIRVPEDIRIVGIDDVMYASMLPVQLTTIHQPCAEIGNMALQVMLERIAQPKMPARDVLLDCELVVRESCGCRGTA